MFIKEYGMIPFGMLALFALFPMGYVLQIMFLSLGVVGTVYQVLCMLIGE
jgi:hypothetical protein